MAAKPRNKSANTDGREAYISFNRDEWGALQRLGFRERWAYAQLKWLANFKTGMVGNFRKQRLTYQEIANLVTAPPSQGRGMGNYDDTQAADCVDHLCAVGLLVKHPKRANGGLLFELPLSPINRKASAVATVAPKPSDAFNLMGDFFPDQVAQKPFFSRKDDCPEFEEIPMATPVCDELTLSLSVMSLTESKNNTDGADAAVAYTAPPSRATGAAAVREIPLAKPEWQRPLTSQAIREELGSSWGWAGLDEPQAWELYELWSQTGLTADLLFQATTALEADLVPDHDPTTPLDLSPFMADLLPKLRLAA